MIIVTGGAGFIGSALVWQLNQMQRQDIIVVDKLGVQEKWRNLRKGLFSEYVHRDKFLQWFDSTDRPKIDAVFHMGACSTTTEKDADFLLDNNTRFSMEIFKRCATHRVPLIYASSAATYGLGEDGFSDDHKKSAILKPINKYGFSKHVFDRWALAQEQKPPRWFGLKFFNVFGPNEYHKGSQSSVILHAFGQIRREQRLCLFKSYREGIPHGEQKRDFVYVKDVVKIMTHLFLQRESVESGLYNIGTGVARSFSDLGRAVFKALDFSAPKFDWIEMPSDIKDQYQYFTQADINKLQSSGKYNVTFSTLEESVLDYVQQYLMRDDPYL